MIRWDGERVARAVDHVECRTGRPALEANQVLLWSVVGNAEQPVAGNEIEER